jgi:DNA-directed RNA polymerase specialized sigma24 family protein
MRAHRSRPEVTEEERRLIAAVYPALARFASTVRCPGHDGNDLLQEALARILERGLLTEIEHPVAYIRRAIVNLAIDHTRSRTRERAAFARHGSPDPTPVVYSWDIEELRDVPPKERAVLFLHAIEGRPYAEIADILGCSQISARVAASRGRRKLLDRMNEQNAEANDAIA